MSSAAKDVELVILRPDTKREVHSNQVIPTVCLVVANRLSKRHFLAELINTFVPLGCNYFVAWGDAANETEDLLDDILETSGRKYLHVATTAHANESAEDVANFAVYSANFGEQKIRVCVALDSDPAQEEEILKALDDEISKAE
jgi:hypothetical protein